MTTTTDHHGNVHQGKGAGGGRFTEKRNSKPGYTIATPQGNVIAQVEHHDLIEQRPDGAARGARLASDVELNKLFGGALDEELPEAYDRDSLRILLSAAPSSDETAEEAAMEFEDFDPNGDSYEWQCIANRLHDGRLEEFTFAFESDSEGASDTYLVGLWVKPLGSYVTRSHDIKYLRGESTGLAAAARAASSLRHDYDSVREAVAKQGLAIGQ